MPLSQSVAALNVAIVNVHAQEAQLWHKLLHLQQCQICWMATTSASALIQIRQNCPDVLLIALELPDVLCCIEQLRQAGFLGEILVVSAALARLGRQAYAAVAAGASGIVSGPEVSRGGELIRQDGLITAIANIKGRLQGSLQGRLQKRLQTPQRSLLQNPLLQQAPQPTDTTAVRRQSTSRALPPLTLPPLVVVGASTGGPRAIATLLGQLSANFPAAILIAQHVKAHFAHRLVPWFQAQTPLRVRPVEAGMSPTAGQVLLAADDRHLVMQPQGKLIYRSPRPEHPYCPSLDRLFESVAEHWPQPGVAILLTGMGRDGAVGMKRFCDRGWHTLAQDAASASIHSMPQAAVDLGAVRDVMSPECMADWLRRRYGPAKG